MYNLEFTYGDEGIKTYHNIVKVTYSQYDDVVLEGEEIFNHQYPLNADIHLYSAERAYTVTSKELKEIAVLKV